MGRLGSETGLETEERDYKILQASYIKVEGRHTLDKSILIKPFKTTYGRFSRMMKNEFQMLNTDTVHSQITVDLHSSELVS